MTPGPSNTLRTFLGLMSPSEVTSDVEKIHSSNRRRWNRGRCEHDVEFSTALVLSYCLSPVDGSLGGTGRYLGVYSVTLVRVRVSFGRGHMDPKVFTVFIKNRPTPLPVLRFLNSGSPVTTPSGRCMSRPATPRRDLSLRPV